MLWHRALNDAGDLLEWSEELFDMDAMAAYDFDTESPELTIHRKVIWQVLTEALVNHEDLIMVYLRNDKRDVRSGYRAVLGECNRQPPSNTTSNLSRSC